MAYISAYSDTVCKYEFRPNSVSSELEICLFRVWSLLFVLRWTEIPKHLCIYICMYKMARKCSRSFKVGDIRRDHDWLGQKHLSQCYHYKPLITNQKSHF